MTNRSLLYVLLLQKNNRFLVLLFAMIVFFTLYPVVENTIIARLILNLFFMVSVLSGVFAIATTRRPLLFSSTLALLAIIFRWIHYFYSYESAAILEHVANVIFWIYIAIYILKFILRQQIITSELIYAAAAVYFIFGLAWASIYQILEISHPISFSLPDSAASKQTFIFQMWYFSMVTLTTLGYGDIAPVTMSARVFVVLEAILGQLYLAILISGLIGKRIAQNQHLK